MTEHPEPILEVIRRQDLTPGDVVILHLPKAFKISQAAYDQYAAFLKETFPEHKHMVLSNGVRIEFRRPAPPKNSGKEMNDAGSERAASEGGYYIAPGTIPI